MEFHEKLQELRKRKGFTQEELARELFVSRTAISKWESGRGYPNIDSLKTIAKFFGVTIDELLSGEELLSIAEKDSQKKERLTRDLVFGLLDCSVAMFFFIPFFGQKIDGIVQAVSLASLAGIAVYLKAAYFAVVIAIAALGFLTLVLQNFHQSVWTNHKSKFSVVVNGIGALLFIISQQPYAAAILFIFLAIKAFLLIKW